MSRDTSPYYSYNNRDYFRLYGMITAFCLPGIYFDKENFSQHTYLIFIFNYSRIIFEFHAVTLARDFVNELSDLRLERETKILRVVPVLGQTYHR